jgi:hypothetical protein
MRRGLKIGIVWAVEFAVLFLLAEIISVFLLPPAHYFYHPQVLFERSSTRAYGLQPNQRAFTIDKPFVTDSMGFRDEREVPVDKDGEFRILSLGDSMALGLGVVAEDTYARQLEALLTPRYGKGRVINAAVASYSTWQEVDLLKEKGLSVRPDVVLLAFYPNDLYPRPVNVVPLPNGQTGEQRDAVWQYVRWLKRSRVLLYLRERFELLRFKVFPSFDWTFQEMIYEGRTSPYLEQGYSDVAASLAEFRSLAELHDFVPILIVFPFPEQVRRPDAPTQMQRRMEAIARRVGLPMVDLLPAMQRAHAERLDLFIPWDNTHLATQGHRLVANALQRYLLESRALTNHRPAEHMAGPVVDTRVSGTGNGPGRPSRGQRRGTAP